MISTAQETTLAELVAERPCRATVLDEFGLDYCCRGGQTLADSCREKQVDKDEVRRRLVECEEAAGEELEVDWGAASLTELVNHIVSVHHRYLRLAFPRLAVLFDRVVVAHASRHPQLIAAQTVLSSLHDELRSHMWKEEHVLFPWIVMLESAEPAVTSSCGSVRNPIHVMEHEHRDAAEALQRLRELTSGYQPPADACPSYRELLRSLHDLEHDLHRHIHKENHILFPRAAALEMTR